MTIDLESGAKPLSVSHPRPPLTTETFVVPKRGRKKPQQQQQQYSSILIPKSPRPNTDSMIVEVDSQASTTGLDSDSVFDFQDGTQIASDISSTDALSNGPSSSDSEDTSSDESSDHGTEVPDLDSNFAAFNLADFPDAAKSELFQRALLKPFEDVEVEMLQIAKYGEFENTSVQHIPLLIYHRCFRIPKTGNMAELLEDHLKIVKAASPNWRHTMLTTDHCHLECHELLLVYQGTAKICFGGTKNANSFTIHVVAGDAIFVPAGVAHCRVTNNNDGIMMIGAYITNDGFDLNLGRRGEGGGTEKRREKIKEQKWFKICPIYGSLGAHYPWQDENFDVNALIEQPSRVFGRALLARKEKPEEVEQDSDEYSDDEEEEDSTAVQNQDSTILNNEHPPILSNQDPVVSNNQNPTLLSNRIQSVLDIDDRSVTSNQSLNIPDYDDSIFLNWEDPNLPLREVSNPEQEETAGADEVARGVRRWQNPFSRVKGWFRHRE